jgi:carbon monoxide dehydrogenase subunit G
MHIEKTCLVKAPVDAVWQALLDPDRLAACMPGIERVEVLEPTRFVVHVAVKVGIVRARFALKVTVVETRPPHYLRSETVGEETGMLSSLRQSTELTLESAGPAETRLAVRTDLDVFGRLGTFGHGVIQAKADRMWQDFAANLAAAVAA